MIDMARVQSAFEQYARDGHELAALDLHVQALVAARNADAAGAQRLFSAAQLWESSNGYGRGALHTSHQMALTANFGGDLARLRAYYDETIGTLRRLRNREGIALCFRSIGELALVHGAVAQAIASWELSERLFAALEFAESQQIAVWLASVRAMFGGASSP